MAPRLAPDFSAESMGGRDSLIGGVLAGLPVSARTLVLVAAGLFGLVGALPGVMRAATVVGVLASEAGMGRLTLWQPLSFARRPKRGIEVVRGDVVVLSSSVRKAAVLGSQHTHFLRVEVRGQVLEVPLGVKPEKFTAVGLISAAQSIGASVRFDGDATKLGGAPRMPFGYDARWGRY